MNLFGNDIKTKNLISLRDCAILILAIGLHLFMLQDKINADIWNDELYTLKHFVLVPFKTTVMDYHVPNNHILFSILERYWLQITGNFDLGLLLEKPYIARIPSVIFSSITIIYTYLIGKKFFNNHIAVIVIVLLLGTLPFFNFAWQIRGYSLSVLLTTALLYYVLGFLGNKKFFETVMIALLTAFLLYAIPSNFYIIFSIIFIFGIFTAITIIRSLKTNRALGLKDNAYFKLVLAIMVGICIALLMYYPVWDSLFHNKYNAIKSTTNPEVITLYLPQIFIELFSGRLVWLIPIFTIGLYVSVKNLKIYKQELISLSFLALAFLLPFGLGYLRGDTPPGRLFVFFIPIFILFLLIIFNRFLALKVFAKSNVLGQLFVVAIVLLNLYTFSSEKKKIDNRLMENNQTKFFDMGLYYNYFDTHFEPNKVIKQYLQNENNQNYPLILHNSQPHDIPDYFKHYNIKYFGKDKTDSLLQYNDSIFLITIGTLSYAEITQSQTSDWQLKPLSDTLYYHNFVLMYRTK